MARGEPAGGDLDLLPSGRSAWTVPTKCLPEGVLGRSLEDVQRNVNTRMHGIIHVIAAISKTT